MWIIVRESVKDWKYLLRDNTFKKVYDVQMYTASAVVPDDVLPDHSKSYHYRARKRSLGQR